VDALRRLGENGAAIGTALGLALLLRPESDALQSAAQSILDFLRPSRALRAHVESIWRLELALASFEPSARAQLVRFARRPGSDEALRLARARTAAAKADGTALARLAQAVASLSPAELTPRPWLKTEDLAHAKVARGPRWKHLLDEAETEQLEGRLASRAQALEWLARRAQELRDS
jgi:poly(A) polymerase